MLAGALVLTLALNGSLGNAWALAGVGSYVFFFELGLGPIPWMIVPELFTADKVVQSQSAGSQINWTMNVVVGLGFPALNAALGAYAFVPFALVLVATLLACLGGLTGNERRTPPEDVSGPGHPRVGRLLRPGLRRRLDARARVRARPARRRTSRGRGAASSSRIEFTRGSPICSGARIRRLASLSGRSALARDLSSAGCSQCAALRIASIPSTVGCAPPSTRRPIRSVSSSIVTASRRSSSVASGSRRAQTRNSASS